MQRRVSMADVALLAGVSGQTVSRVVNESPRVDPDTRRRVEEAMAELGYRPHRAARALRTGRSHTIGSSCRPSRPSATPACCRRSPTPPRAATSRSRS